ncbi:MAG: GntR family transcriptional regulator [Afipia sp.]|jgi:DNA-binding GntR family transcriptional regulator|nr:GntR family transcriptional regulator [Afipia sp.]
MAKKTGLSPPPESQADTAHRRLEEMIVTLQLPPGSHWSEEGLADQIGIGRTPVREAVKRLQADYLVSILPRHGLMITEINVHEQLLVIEFRRELEAFISRRAALRIAASEKELLTVAAREIDSAGAKGNLQKYLREVFNANRLIATASGNPFAAKSISPLHAMSRRFYYRYERDLQNLGAMGKLHAERARAVVQQDEKLAVEKANGLMDQIENYTRRIFNLSVGAL